MHIILMVLSDLFYKDVKLCLRTAFDIYARYLFTAAALGLQVPSRRCLLFRCSVGNCKRNVNVETV